LNALNVATISDLNKAFKILAANDEIRVIVLTGSGEKKHLSQVLIFLNLRISSEEGAQLAAEGQEKLFDFVENLKRRYCSRERICIGWRIKLAMACHFRVASENAKMGLPEVSLGVIPGYGGTQRLPQLIKRTCHGNDYDRGMVTAQDAYRTGLVNHVVPEGNFDYCISLANKIIKNSVCY
jgi:enoyl-CoA hydratase